MHPDTLTLALVSAGVLGFRHGFDYDHIAAISDITSVETTRRRAMRMGLVYVMGHATMVSLLAAVVILFQRSLPVRIDGWPERGVGLTLVVLGLYVLGTLFKQPGEFVPRSRASILIDLARWLAWKVKSIFASDAVKPERRSGPYRRGSVFLIGIIHGLGAETPSQLLLFLLAANLGGLIHGFLGLAMFLTGLLTMNMLMTASAVGLFGLSAARPNLLRFVIGTTAAYSVVVGSVFLLGASRILPPIGG